VGGADLLLVASDERLDPERPWADGPPIVLVSLSAVGYPDLAPTLQRIIDGLATLPVRAVVTTGPVVDPSELSPAANTEIQCYRPHSELRPTASLLISHGGHAPPWPRWPATCPC